MGPASLATSSDAHTIGQYVTACRWYCLSHLHTARPWQSSASARIFLPHGHNRSGLEREAHHHRPIYSYAFLPLANRPKRRATSKRLHHSWCSGLICAVLLLLIAVTCAGCLCRLRVWTSSTCLNPSRPCWRSTCWTSPSPRHRQLQPLPVKLPVKHPSLTRL